MVAVELPEGGRGVRAERLLLATCRAPNTDTLGIQGDPKMGEPLKIGA